MAWARFEHLTPPPYRGIQMRSHLEMTVAQELDALGVVWEYEQPAYAFAGAIEPIKGYLPDFTIHEAAPELELPPFIEVKPADLLTATCNYYGVTTDDLGRGDVVVAEECTARALKAAGLEEIWKPQRLAEIIDTEVLVCSAINCFRRISIVMRGTSMVLSRRHPGVNWKQTLKDRERRRLEAEWEEQRIERDRRQAKEDEERRKALRSALTQLLRADRHALTARFDGLCWWCSCTRPATQLRLLRASEQWVTVCSSCVRELTAA